MTSDSRGAKRSLNQSTTNGSEVEVGGDWDQENGLKMWGYMPGHVHYNLSQGIDAYDSKVSPSEETADQVEKAMHAVPSRSITDAFINHFLAVVNYRYNSIYGPTFTEKYVQWWSDRANGNCLSSEFTCLLLRILSYSVQYLTPSLRKMVEFELACNSQVLTERFSTAAEQLSKSFPPSNTSIERVQEQFLKGAWLKSESRIVESWHALGNTIRQAQELGIDKETRCEGLSEFDIEIRRRLWVLLFVWDWQMSTWLGRPHLIDQKDVFFIFPNLRLDQTASDPNLLSPFAHISLQAKLARRISVHMSDIQVIRDWSDYQVSAVLDEVHKFIDELPPVFRLTNTNYSLDEAHPYYVFQRHQLHVSIYMSMLDFLKRFLAQNTRAPRTPRDDEFRKMGVELGLKLLVVARGLFDHEYPINAKFHMVVFCIFDTATILCSAIIHDVHCVLPHRKEVMDAVESALGMLHQLTFTTKLGASSYRFLSKLVYASLAFFRHSTTAKRQRVSHADEPASITPPLTIAPQVLEPVVPETDATYAALSTVSMPPPDLSTTDDLSFDLDDFMAQNPGGMGAIWDWENLNLDFSGQGQDWGQQWQ
ncbi:hypothetical protein P280DRAFT_447861 [Massarina eburnea CBS 473.64]|uniref:Xylanolytic transcriptional activator regulatory domain-containing protein n=1 Tax=Massarina eburnea CBS 473.64 TaxID=1395130 RepID=A0A6A6S4E2_9PLEO|nr:hypothetical protein P280DRAFT_447861 [Massarina eburnea CBS 473.64]